MPDALEVLIHVQSESAAGEHNRTTSNQCTSPADDPVLTMTASHRR